MINHFAGETALKIEEDGYPQQPARWERQKRPLMKVGVDQVRTQVQRLLQSQRAQQEIIGDPVQRWADLQPPSPGKEPGASDIQAGDIFSGMIGTQANLMTTPLQKLYLLQNAHVTAIVGKERGGGNGQNSQSIFYLTPH